jgi:hypothetical protein
MEIDIFWVMIEITWDFGHAPMDARRNPTTRTTTRTTRVYTHV